MWPIIFPTSIVLCVFVYSKMKSIGWIAFIVVVTLILLIPSTVYFWARMENRRILSS
ncbi:hypothetical protein ACVCNR_17325 (plasmid) [Aquamicrobium terrae]|uniref:NADH:ubiquinone oxidoreductase subunit 3 (Subunit A) n=1 Tax=Aquamicrobium terrae TaxID=1324945 RepID=A0ABV2N7A3_9HYPH